MNKPNNLSERKQAFYKYIVNETIRLKQQADELWIAMDAPQLKNEFDALLTQYNDVCDRIDYLEVWPEHARAGHFWKVQDVMPGLSTIVCSHCGKRFRVFRGGTQG